MKNERRCIDCPAFYEVKQDNISATAGGWETKTIDGKKVLLCRPQPVLGGKRMLQRYSYYCRAKQLGKKIGTKAGWTGRTPIWCPLGREVE